MVKGYGNTTRWLEQVGVSLEELVGIAKGNGSKVDVPTMPKGLEVKGRPLPVFFYGDEDESLVNAAAVSVASSGGGNATGGQKKDGAKAGGGKGSPAAAAASTGEAGGLTEAQKKAAADKRAAKAATKSAKKAKQPNPADTAAEKDIDISALDIRVGKIIRAWEHESAEKLYCEEIDVGEDSPRKIASGLRPFYKLDEMQDRMVLVLCNLKARNLVGFPSHGMVLCASNADHTAVEFAVPPPTAKIGDRVMFDGITGEPEAENKVAKKKMFEVLAPDLKTDEGGVMVWKGKRSCVGESGESCRAVGGMAGAQVS
jgi:methionine--tRNA ligase beta chain